MGLFYTKQLRDFWQTTFPTIVGVGTRMQFIIKSEILDGRLTCKWERKKKKIKMHHSLLAVTVAWATVGLSAAGLM